MTAWGESDCALDCGIEKALNLKAFHPDFLAKSMKLQSQVRDVMEVISLLFLK